MADYNITAKIEVTATLADGTVWTDFVTITDIPQSELRGHKTLRDAFLVLHHMLCETLPEKQAAA